MVTKISISDFWEHLGKDGWEGYIWRVSYDNGPRVFQANEKVEKPTDLAKYNRIQEANFYNQAEQTSLHVKLIDGEELVYLYKIKGLNTNKLKLSNEIIYEGSKSDLNELKFRNLFQLTESPVSKGAFSWVHLAQVFAGYVKKLNDK